MSDFLTATRPAANALPALARRLAAGLAAATLSLGALAQVSVQEPWVRGTVAQQSATGLFVRITAPQGGRLVAASSPLAGVVEIHEMSMDGTTMRMRAIAALDLPAGEAVTLRPGGHHLMLMDLKRPLKAGERVPVSLVVELAGGQRQTLEIAAEVRALGAAARSEPAHHGHRH